MKLGDEVTGESGETYVLGEQLAYQGKPECTDIRCSRIGERCVGWHCPICNAPVSSQGHKCPNRMEPA